MSLLSSNSYVLNQLDTLTYPCRNPRGGGGGGGGGGALVAPSLHSGHYSLGPSCFYRR